MIRKINTNIKFEINGNIFIRTEDPQIVYWSEFNYTHDKRFTFYKDLNAWIHQRRFDNMSFWTETTECDIPFMELEYQKYMRKEKLNRILND
jgi:hypothetical protein